MADARKPTIHELEAILGSEEPGRVSILPDGQVRVAPPAGAAAVLYPNENPATQTEATITLDRAGFRNCVASLYNIDKHKVDAALRLAEQAPLTGDDWMKFRDDPARFFMNTDLPTAQAIWACVLARQPKSECA